MIEDMRKCYRGCEPFLSTTIRQVEQSDIVKEAKIEALKSIAKTMFGIDLAEVKIAKEKELGKELGSDEEIELLEIEIKKLREHQDPQIIVAEEELERHLEEGWEFVSVLPSKKILVRKDG
jgi:transcriptional regulator with XRE-family HTH domain